MHMNVYKHTDTCICEIKACKYYGNCEHVKLNLKLCENEARSADK